jgi:hypothetical protein
MQGLLSLDERLEIYNSFKSIVDASEFALEEADDSDLTLYQTHRRDGDHPRVEPVDDRALVEPCHNLLMDTVTTRAWMHSSKSSAFQT